MLSDLWEFLCSLLVAFHSINGHPGSVKKANNYLALPYSTTDWSPDTLLQILSSRKEISGFNKDISYVHR